MFLWLLVKMECLVVIELDFGMVLVDFTHEQGRTFAILTQASPSRLSESCRNLFLVLGSSVLHRRPVWCWAICSLNQARMARSSEVVTKRGVFCVESSSRRGVLCLSEGESRSGKKDSLEREIMVSHYFILA